ELFELTELIDWLTSGGTGWRYLLLTSYRRKGHQRWRQKTRLTVAGGIFWGALTFFFTWVLSPAVVYFIIELSQLFASSDSSGRGALGVRELGTALVVIIDAAAVI